jgi:hypothetical protein
LLLRIGGVVVLLCGIAFVAWRLTPPTRKPVPVPEVVEAPRLELPKPPEDAPPVTHPPEQTAMVEPETLAEVHTIYVRPAPGKFEELMASAIRDKLKDDIEVVEPEQADAVLWIVFQDDQGSTARNASDSLEKLKGKITATAALRTRQGGKTLWTGEANDKRKLFGKFGDKTKRLAARLAEELRDARKK